jgi:2,5-dihydroxypyridine 5,6-dioxygenase
MLTGPLTYLRKPIVANVEPGMNVLVLTDTAHDPRVWQAVMSIVADCGAEPTVALFDPRPADYYNPPKTVCQAMLGSDVNVLLATTGMLHSEAAMEAMTKGVPSICMDGGMTLEMFQAGAVTADYAEVAWLKYKVASSVFGVGARLVRVTSEHGMDLTYSVENRVYVPPQPRGDRDPLRVWRRAEEGRKTSLYACVYPTGEFNVPPVEGSANGTAVIDLTMHRFGRLLSPIHLDVREGRIVEIRGGAEARELEAYLSRYGDENAYCFPTEASIGVNPAARVTGNQREDKNIFGSIHFGLGTNVDVGGTLRSKIHMDGVVLRPTMYVDGKEQIRNGRFLADLRR